MSALKTIGWVLGGLFVTTCTIGVLGAQDTATSKAIDDHQIQADGINRAELDRSFDALDWDRTTKIILEMDRSAPGFETLAEEYEERALAEVLPLPASNAEGNLSGYRLLAAIRPENETYQSKIAHYEASIQRARERVIGRLRSRYEKLDDITWYHHPNQPQHVNSRSTAFLYLGQHGTNGRVWPRLKVQYTDDNWLFVREVSVWHDGIREPLVSGTFSRDNNTSIWEWIDVPPNEYQLEVLRSVASASEVVLRFEGAQTRRDVTLSRNDKVAISEVIAAYEAFEAEAGS